jgi:hypothetical protein
MTNDARTIQEVLRLHVESSESMLGTFQGIGDKEGAAMQSGITSGLQRAIEVADVMAKRNAPLPNGTQTPWGKVVKYGPAYWCVKDNGVGDGPDGTAIAIDAGMLEATVGQPAVKPVDEVRGDA